MLKILLNADSLEVNADYQPGKGVITTSTPLAELFMSLEGLVDVEAESSRLNKELEKIRLEITKVEEKLANPAFTQKVPPQVLAEHQKRRGDWQTKLDQTTAALKALEGT